VRRHAESDNSVLYAVLVELRCNVAAVAINDKQSVRSSCT
jgi:hypothetical protein